MNKQTPPNYYVIIVAAGSGKRFDSEMPKQYLKLNHQSVLEQTLSRFVEHPLLSQIVVVLSENDHYWPTTCYAKHRKISTVIGGSERYKSVNNALQYLATTAKADDWIIVHDAARPCLTREDLEQLMNQLPQEAVGALLGCPVNDTMKHCEQQKVQATVPRQDLWRALTPQAFRYRLLTDALAHCFSNNITITDESSAIEAMGLSPTMIAGDSSNIKITYASDFVLAKFIIEQQEQS